MTSLHIPLPVAGLRVGSLVLLALVVSACDVRITVVQGGTKRPSSHAMKEQPECAGRD